MSLFPNALDNLPTGHQDGIGEIIHAAAINDLASAVNAVEVAVRGRVFNVRHYGAVGDGIADDTAAIQAAIDAACGTADPVTTTRVPIGPVYLPAGTYRTTAALNVVSVLGFRLYGDGPFLSEIRPSGTFTDALLINGSAYGNYENFSIEVTGGVVTNLVHLEWLTASAHRSTTQNGFRNVFVGEAGGSCVTAFAIGTDAGDQNDGNCFYNCQVSCGWTAGDTTTAQAGFQMGWGATGNCLNHFFYGCNVAGARYGWYGNKSNFYVYGTESASCEILFKIVASFNYVIDGVNAESCAQLADFFSPGGTSPLTLSNVAFRANLIDGTHPYWVHILAAGVHTLSNLSVSGVAAGQTATVCCGAGTGDGCLILVDGLTQPTPIATGIVADPTNWAGWWDVRGYCETDNAGVVVRGYATPPGPFQSFVGGVNAANVESGLTETLDTTAKWSRVLATGAAHTVDDVIAALQTLGVFRQA